MSVTTVVDTGRKPPVLSSNWQSQMNPQDPSTNNATEKFPTIDDESFEEESRDEAAFDLPPTSSLRYSQKTAWQPRQTNGSNPRGLLNSSKRRSRKSISEAIGAFRTRGTSVSENAQELAESLKAPISYKLTVCFLVSLITFMSLG